MSKPIPIRIAYNPEQSNWEDIVPEQYKAEGENNDWAKVVRHEGVVWSNINCMT